MLIACYVNEILYSCNIIDMPDGATPPPKVSKVLLISISPDFFLVTMWISNAYLECFLFKNYVIYHDSDGDDDDDDDGSGGDDSGDGGVICRSRSGQAARCHRVVQLPTSCRRQCYPLPVLLRSLRISIGTAPRFYQ